jgi:hypothetical protein
MGGRLALALLLVGACNGAQLHNGHSVGPDAQSSDAAPNGTDAPMSSPDAPVALGPWGTPQLIPGASDPTLSEDDGTPNQTLTELYFGVVTANNGKDLYWMTRATPNDPWGPKQVLMSTPNADESPRLSPDELTLYYGHNGDIYQMTRATLTSPWGGNQLVPAVNVVGNATYEKWMAVCDNNYYMLSRDSDLWEGTLGSAPTKVTSLSTTGSEISTWLSKDCLTVMFARTPPMGQTDIYISTRASTSAPWPAATALPDFNTVTSNEEDPWMSCDGHTFVFASNAAGTKDLYMSTR